MPNNLRESLAEHLPAMYRLAFLMAGTHAEACDRLRGLAQTCGAALTSAPSDPLGLLARHLEFFYSRTEEGAPRNYLGRFEQLDDLLREDLSEPVDINTPGIDGDVRRINAMLWELKRSCLAATLRCVPASIRCAFALTVLGHSAEESARLLDIKPSALRIRLGRAKRQLDAYLGPRCQHVDLRNPCRCVGRLEGAMRKGFVSTSRLRSLPLPLFEPRRQEVVPLLAGVLTTLEHDEAKDLLEFMLAAAQQADHAQHHDAAPLCFDTDEVAEETSAVGGV